MGLLNRVGRMLGGRQREDNSNVLSMAQLLLAQVGGLHGLQQRFQQSGLGAVMESWIGPGPNQAITATQVQQALGSGPLVMLASRLGLEPRELAAQLARHLPGIVDSMTPDGRLPAEGSPQSLGAGLRQSLLKH